MKRVASWNSSKYITASSFMFSLPMVYFISEKNNDHLKTPCGLLLLTSFISANYWRNALDDWRRTLDIYMARITYSYYFFNGCMVIPFPFNIIGFGSSIGSLYFFDKSNKEYENKNKHWVNYHLGFHGFLTINSFLVLYFVNKKYNPLKI